MIKKSFYVKVKKICLILLIIVMSALFMACEQRGSEEINTTGTEINNAIHENPAFAGYFMDGMELDIEDEEEYDNFSFQLSVAEFDQNEDFEIECTIINNNVGKGFYYYQIPYVEYEEDGKWERLAYNPPQLLYEENWFYSGVEGNTLEPNEARIYFYKKYLDSEMKKGDFRLVLFVGQEVFYANFKVV